MRGLRKFLTPFAPDQSGAVSVLYELGGLVVICDAGGCTGNICGFDEPRWFGQKSALFSAGLRDMDAILGRDDRLVEKLVDAASKLDVKFVAIIGTPVPAVIGTDYRALARMCQKKMNLPVLTVDTDGMELYDVGEEKAWLALFQTFSEKKEEDSAEEYGDKIGILGLTPQDVSDLYVPEKIKKYYQKNGKEAICYCMGTQTSEDLGECLHGLKYVRTAGKVKKNVVVAVAALETAKYLEKIFGTPYEIEYPIVAELVPDMDYRDKKILIVHQQIIGNAIREEIKRRCEKESGGAVSENTMDITVASWFMMKEELKEKNDVSLREEDDYMELVRKEDYDIVFADPMMRRMTEAAYALENDIPGKNRAFVEATHFAVSGKLRDEKREA